MDGLSCCVGTELLNTSSVVERCNSPMEVDEYTVVVITVGCCADASVEITRLKIHGPPPYQLANAVYTDGGTSAADGDEDEIDDDEGDDGVTPNTLKPGFISISLNICAFFRLLFQVMCGGGKYISLSSDFDSLYVYVGFPISTSADTGVTFSINVSIGISLIMDRPF